MREKVDDGADAPAWIDRLAPVGILHEAPHAWVARRGADLADPALTGIVLADGAITEAVLTGGLPARAMGLKATIVPGYGGSSEQIAAILRGEVDATVLSFASASDALSDPGLAIAMVATVGPAPEAPDLPYLAGEGGVVDRRTQGLDPAARAQAMHLAEVAARNAGVMRALFVPRALDPDLGACLRAAVDAALFDPAFAEAANAQRRPVAPVGPDEAEALFEAARAAFVEVRPMMPEIEAGLQ